MDATRPWRLEGVVRRYAWGSRTAIPELLGREPDGEPQAELWLGAHPSAPSRVVSAAGAESLDACIRRDPEAVLGASVRRRFGDELPFLFKVLAAAEPLSIQAHPDRDQARAGFARENAAGLAVDAPTRSYRDPHHKPELICALTPFRALNRFREPAAIADALAALGVAGLAPLVAELRAASPREALASFFGAWMGMEPGAREALVAEVAAAAGARSGDAACAEVAGLAERHPGDAGVLAPFFLHLVELAPGEAMFLPAGQLHAYLDGTALELMANSDNVLRGGLTPKHVDVPELLATLRFEPGDPGILGPRAVDAPTGVGRARYDTPAEEFRLEVLTLERGGAFPLESAQGPRILLAVRGALRVSGPGGEVASLSRGEALFLPDALVGHRLEGEATAFLAAVGPADAAVVAS
jgi:mannose-6-phosphate isomerase